MFELNLSFPDRNESDLITLNTILSGLALKKLEFDFESYRRTSTTRDAQGNIISVEYSCGFDTVQIKGYLEEDLTEAESTLHRYQVYTDYLPAGQNIDTNFYLDQWGLCNPQYSIKTCTTIQHDNGGMSHVIVYSVD